MGDTLSAGAVTMPAMGLSSSHLPQQAGQATAPNSNITKFLLRPS
jgi:hypothetical protein